MTPSTCPYCGLHRRHAGLCPNCGDPDALVSRFERRRHLERDWEAGRVLVPRGDGGPPVTVEFTPSRDLWSRETESDAYRGRAERQTLILIACAWAVVGMLVGWVALRVMTGVWVP